MAAAMQTVMDLWPLLKSADRASRQAVLRHAVKADGDADRLVQSITAMADDGAMVPLVMTDCRYQTSAFARRLLDYIDDQATRLLPMRALELARCAAAAVGEPSHGSAGLLFRAWKAQANSLCDLARIEEAHRALRTLREIIASTKVQGFRASLVTYLQARLCAAERRTEEAEYLLKCAAAELDPVDFERAASARLYCMRIYWFKGDFAAAIVGYTASVKRALRNRDDLTAARDIFNIGLCLGSLNQPARARRYFRLAWRKFGAAGDPVAAAKMRRCEARMAIRDGQVSGVGLALAAGEALERIGMAGEAVWTMVDTIAELREYQPQYDVAPLCQVALQRAVALRLTTATVDLLQILREQAMLGVDPQFVRGIADRIDLAYTNMADTGGSELTN